MNYEHQSMYCNRKSIVANHYRAIIMFATNGWHFWYFGWFCLCHQCLNDVVGFVSIL
jgi:hypothetical protein